MKTRIHVYPWTGETCGEWAIEQMTDWQAFLNDLKLFGLRIALVNLWMLWTRQWPSVGGNIIPFRRK
jgi:hypothetical protein